MNTREWVALYISRGWYPVPLKPGDEAKECRDKDWLDRVYLPEDFDTDGNVGLRLVSSRDEDRSVKLIAVDVDAVEITPEAISKLLPPTQAAWGRASKPVSQLLYVASFERPVMYKDAHVRKGDPRKPTLIEIRLGGQHSACPPTVHPSGEQLRWLDEQVIAPEVEPEVLHRGVRLLATYALIARYYNPPGDRHSWGLALAGFFRQLGLTVDEAETVLTLAGQHVQDREIRDRIGALRTTYARSDDEPTAGAGQLAELTGEPGKDLVRSLRKIWGSGDNVSGFVYNEKGDAVLARSQQNIRKALEMLDVTLSWNRFSEKLLARNGTGVDHAIDDALLDRLWLETENRFRFLPPKDYFTSVVFDTARNRPFHPVRDYLDSLSWDRKPRLDRWLTTYGGAADVPYVHAVGVIFALAAVRRVRQPGCKFDELLILESPQGWNKSTALRALCPDDSWFSDDLPLGVDSKQLIEHTSGKWIIEAAELSGMRKREADHLKASLSRQVDGPVRLAYQRVSVEVPRQFVLVGTTNSSVYLEDLTGGRRFWPVKVQLFDVDGIIRDRDQLWAEAAEREAAGESIRLSRDLWEVARRQQEHRTHDDAWSDVLQARFPPDQDWRITPNEVWDALGIDITRRDERGSRRLSALLQNLGFVRMKVRLKGAGDRRTTNGWGRDASGIISFETHKRMRDAKTELQSAADESSDSEND